MPQIHQRNRLDTVMFSTLLDFGLQDVVGIRCFHASDQVVVGLERVLSGFHFYRDCSGLSLGQQISWLLELNILSGKVLDHFRLLAPPHLVVFTTLFCLLLSQSLIKQPTKPQFPGQLHTNCQFNLFFFW